MDLSISILKPADSEWDEVMEWAAKCAWVAGPRLAQKMRDGDFKSWERVFAASRDGQIDGQFGRQILGYCTLTEVDCIPDVVYAPFIGFVFVDPVWRGRRISEVLIQHACDYAKTLGYAQVYVATREEGLYEKFGFVRVDCRPDFWGEPAMILTRGILTRAHL